MPDVLVLAHRGLPRQYPENSIRGLAASMPHADAVEFDVRQAACGTLVCVHDATLARTADTDLAVATSTWAALHAADPAIARLEDVLEALLPHTAVSVDIKRGGNGMERAVIAALRAAGADLQTADAVRCRRQLSPGCAVVEAPGFRSLWRVRRAAPDIGRLCVLPGRVRPVLVALAALALRTVGHGVALPKRQARGWLFGWMRALSMRVWVYTVNDVELSRTLAVQGADAIFSDVPDELRAADAGRGTAGQVAPRE